MEKLLDTYLLNARLYFSEAELLAYGRFFDEVIIERYLNNLEKSNFPRFIKIRTIPEFEEELPVPYSEIWQIHHEFINSLTQCDDKDARDLIHFFFSERLFSEFLIVLGQRITPASIQTSEALPPEDAILLEQAFKPYNSEIKIAVRAWEKHVGRNENDFWGKIDGSPHQKEEHVRELVNSIMAKHSWWNVFGHFKHGTVYEIRSESGHGLRWSIDQNKFIGFVEPF
ncbi:MAG: hypothetical protein GQ574_12795 [Crocinitomix sp.]|nr:hypothetical protein [Crocinitomix sp.]